MTSPYDWIARSSEIIRQANWHRSPKTITSHPGPVVELEGRSLINFASNDYLGLAAEPRLKQAAMMAVEKYGTGSTGSRLLSGHRDIHRQLELALADLKQTEDAIVFSSGYLANLGTIAALVGQRDSILGDRYNHSSLKNAAKLSGATAIDYDHCDTEDLHAKLEQHRTQYRRCLIVTDSIFSMDGDICQLPQVLNLADAYECMVLVDEAHATGIMGERGAGCVEYLGCTGRPLIQMGTLSKALGSLGGYVAGEATLIDFLRNRAATWIYTTGLSPADTAAAIAAVEIIQTEPQRLEKLWQNVNFLKQNLSHLKLLPSESPILCLECIDPSHALELSQKLKLAGIFAPAIRPPTVPTSRLRFSVMATHEREHLQQLVECLSRLSRPIATIASSHD